ncbi:MAG TPA: ABC transporter [Burkholderiales bacterium]|nr:ABC transporter [Burkholderiales bacterium]
MKKTLVLLSLALPLAGCGGAAAPEPRSYDLGLEAPAAKLPAVRVGGVRAAAPFDGTDMFYRLAYRNASEIAAFTGSRWAAPPAEMLRKQLQRASAESGKCTLSVEIQEFTQVFSAKDASEGRVELLASLSGGATRRFAVAEGRAGADAVGGAGALARASNRAIGELAGWIAAQPGCR